MLYWAREAFHSDGLTFLNSCVSHQRNTCHEHSRIGITLRTSLHIRGLHGETPNYFKIFALRSLIDTPISSELILVALKITLLPLRNDSNRTLADRSLKWADSHLGPRRVRPFRLPRLTRLPGYFDCPCRFFECDMQQLRFR